VGPVNHALDLDGGQDPPWERALLGIMYLTPLEQWTCPVFAPPGHNAQQGETMRPCASITIIVL